MKRQTAVFLNYVQDTLYICAFVCVVYTTYVCVLLFSVCKSIKQTNTIKKIYGNNVNSQRDGCIDDYLKP